MKQPNETHFPLFFLLLISQLTLEPIMQWIYWPVVQLIGGVPFSRVQMIDIDNQAEGLAIEAISNYKTVHAFNLQTELRKAHRERGSVLIALATKDALGNGGWLSRTQAAITSPHCAQNSAYLHAPVDFFSQPPYANSCRTGHGLHVLHALRHLRPFLLVRWPTGAQGEGAAQQRSGGENLRPYIMHTA